MAARRIAITGSSGLIGGALARALDADGDEVVRVVRPGSSSAGGAVARWDVEAGTIDAAALEGLDAVVHLAGEGIAEKRWNDEQKRRILESRTKGTTLLARTLAELSAPPKVLVSGSAIGYYGDRGDEVLDETSGPGKGFLSDLVVAWEAAAQPAADAGIRTAFIRTGIVLDGDGGILGKTGVLYKLGLGGRLGSGRQWMSWVSLTDQVAAIRFIIERDGLEGPVNVTGPAPVTNAEFTKAVGAVVHRPTFLAVPRFAPALLVGKELAENLLFASQRVQPTVLEREGIPFEHREVTAAVRSALGR
ncbi:MAG: TIGR01777 family protein [Acidimicrobiia bacterium]|nr:TIGR01777 family protein [Acidimicrobiia bacterium]